MERIEDLYRQHGPAILTYLRRSFGRCASPEEMLHETFVQALRRPQRLQEAVSAKAWLFGVARHVGLTAVRRHRWVEPLQETVATPEVDPRLAAMREAIAGLESTLREPLELRLHENLTYEEIAQAMQIPIGTVRSRLHTAMRKLREAMNT